MIKVIQDKRIDWFVKFILPSEELLSLDPIIAGGSMLSLYRAIKLHNTDSKWQELRRSLEKNPKMAKIDSFGDIDIWFHSKNPIHNKLDSGERHEYHWLIADFNKDSSSPFNPASSSGLNPHSVGQKPYFTGKLGARYAFPTEEERKNAESQGLAPGILGLGKIDKSTGWANSYRSTKPSRLKPMFAGEIQFIKKPATSVEDLLSSFDFINCSVAWHDGKLYYDDRIDDAFSNFELCINSTEPFERDSIAMRVFGAIRAYKYSDRYCIDFDQMLTEYIFKLYVDSKNIDYKKYGDKVIEIETLYGKSVSSVNTLKGMVSHFHSMFNKFIKMKYFKPEYALYLVDCADTFNGLKDFIENNPTKEGSGIEIKLTKPVCAISGKQNIPF